MSKAECGLERPVRTRFVISTDTRYGSSVEFFLQPSKLARRREELKRRGVSHTWMAQDEFPASFHSADGEWYPVYDPSSGRTIMGEYIHPRVAPLVEPTTVPWKHDDGGRAEAGYKGQTGDCVTRSIAIATGKPYKEVYEALFALRLLHVSTRRDKVARRIEKRGASPRNGVHKTTYRPYLESLGWKFVPTMSFGSGTKVHLRPDELPKGRLIVRVSKHITTMIDGVIHDTYDCSRQGTRCVYGYFHKP